MDESSAVNYEAVLADLRAKRERLAAAIAAIEALIRHQTPHGQSEPQARTAQPALEGTAPSASFQGMSILDASRKVLQNKGQCQRTKEILRALQAGGIALTGKSPINNVGAVLNTNLKKGGGIVRVKRGVWSLASWQAQAEGKVAAIDDDRADAHRSTPMQYSGHSTQAVAHA